MKYLLSILMLAVIINSCTTDKKNKSSLFTTTNLPLERFNINTDSANTLVSAEGCIIQIPANAIVADSKKIEITIRTAISTYAMAKAGLSTTSNGIPLSSGGMIFFDAPTAKSMKIVKPIRVYIPTASIDTSMKVFDGAYTADSSITWVNPRNMETSAAVQTIDKGANLFAQNCSSCHKLDEKSVGPPLYYCYNRMSKKLLYQFTRNAGQVIASGNEYANCMFGTYSKTQMTAFPHFTDTDLDAIYSFIKNESERHPELKESMSSNNCDSCVIYERLRNKIRDKIEALITNNEADAFSIDNSPITSNGTTVQWPSSTTGTFTTASLPTKAVYYQFTITAQGWYNLDVFLHNCYNVKPASLSVRINGEDATTVNTSLLIPSFKVCVQGWANKNSIFGFGVNKWTYNTKAFIVANSERNGKLYFALVPFTTDQNNELTIDLRECSAKEVEKQMAQFANEGMTVEVSKTKNYDRIVRATKEEEAIAHWKPYHCNCDSIYPWNRDESYKGREY